MNVTIGARVVKTGIAVALALYITHQLGLKGVTIAGVAAIFAIQPSVYKSWQHMLEQVQTNTLGAILALGVSLVMPVNEVVVGLTCIAVILITLALRMETTVTLTLVTTIVVLEAGGEWMYALERFSTILIGIASAFLVNAVVMPPNHRKQFLDGYREALGTMSLLLRTAVSDELKEGEAKSQRDKLNDTVRKISERYGMLEEEWRKWKRFRPQPGRHLVVQKQMVRAMTVGQLVLDAVQVHYFPQRKDDSADRAFDDALEELIRYHEYALLKYEGKMKPGEQLYDKIGELTERLLRDAIESVGGEPKGSVSLVVVASAIYEYGRQLRRLDKMVGHVQGAEEAASAE
ncbi:aromatic acid exporter family protein [Paenibacillus antri]|uniref:Aromatic acid exporter family protein n=1 Tax=Paenibacillus antri TaxID=2582848 RepID=A0A5R9FZG2_9BACL|nr:aromatic acid exporter family protein [Paenibacillus antri]TLS49457.1 aromatic acid exporter family protein [Paenibacillus antri]